MFEKETKTVFRKKANKIAERKVKEFYKECGWEDYKYMIDEFADVGVECCQYGYNKALEDKNNHKVCNCMRYFNFKDLENENEKLKKECEELKSLKNYFSAEKKLDTAKSLLEQLVNIEYAVNIPKEKIISLKVKAEHFLEGLQDED